MRTKAMESKREPSLGLNNYLTVAKAAGFLGVSVSTLRNWDRSGKLKPIRNPLNGYRLYRLEDLEELLHTLDRQRNQ